MSSPERCPPTCAPSLIHRTPGPLIADVAATRRLRDDDQFARFWTSRLVTLAGTAVTLVALPVLVYDLSGSPVLTALVAALEALPYLLVGLIAGALADRWERKRVMITTDVLNAVALASLPTAYLLDVLTVGHVLVVAFVVPLLFVFFDAADFGALPLLVGRDLIPRAQSALWSSGTVVELAVPALAGAALAFVEAPVLLTIDAASYLVSAVLVAGIRRPMSLADRPRQPLRPALLLADVKEGLRWLWRHVPVRVMTFAGAAQAACGGLFVGQLVVWADRVLDVRAGDARLGILFASWSVGSLVATLVLPRLAERLGAARVALLALPCSAVLAICVALSGHWLVACALTAAWGAAYMMVVVNSITFRQQVTPDPLMSRVNTTGRMLSFGLGWPIGSLVGGVVSQAAGPRAALLVGSLAVVAGAVGAWLSPLRHTGRDVAAEPA